MIRAKLAVRCPAKVNLLLRVLGRRQDGYHEIETLFQAIELWDEVEAFPSEDLTLTCDDPTLPVDGSNLVLLAARRLRDEAPDGRPGASLHLRKTIPVGGGLGGGSSDAAGTLVLLSRMWGLGPGTASLERIAASLGADVAFFLRGGTAWGTGRGDRIEPLPFAGPLPILLGIPPFGIATAEVYRRFAPRLTPSGNGVSVRRFSAAKWRERNDFKDCVNDLEPVVLEGWPELARFREALAERDALLARVSGSGSTVFGVFRDDAALAEAERFLGSRFPRWRIVASRASARGVEVRDPGGSLDRQEPAGD